MTRWACGHRWSAAVAGRGMRRGAGGQSKISAALSHPAAMPNTSCVPRDGKPSVPISLQRLYKRISAAGLPLLRLSAQRRRRRFGFNGA